MYTATVRCRSNSGPRTIWDNQSSMSTESTSSGPTHFSFPPRPTETRPGAITPTYLSNSSNRTSRPSYRAVPIGPKSQSQSTEKLSNSSEKEASSNKTQSSTLPKSSKIPTDSKTSVTLPRSPITRNIGITRETTPPSSSSTSTLKSCLKTDSRSSSLSRQITSNSSSKQTNVNFKSEISNQPKVDDNLEGEGPFEWVDFKKADGETVKGVILPPLSKKESTKNTFKADEITSNLEQPKYANSRSNSKERNLNPFLTEVDPNLIKSQDNSKILDKKDDKVDIAPLAIEDDNSSLQMSTEKSCYACDACTQTPTADKKSGCNVM